MMLTQAPTANQQWQGWAFQRSAPMSLDMVFRPLAQVPLQQASYPPTIHQVWQAVILGCYFCRLCLAVHPTLHLRLDISHSMQCYCWTEAGLFTWSQGQL